uniref:Partial AB-hydrolase lipase domain-containing protein n=1 Tax=Sipha flava TaxID=143950 RepID=A0A2S2R015_9HEMI
MWRFLINHCVFKHFLRTLFGRAWIFFILVDEATAQTGQAYVASDLIIEWEKIKANGYPLKMYEYMSEDRFMLGMERIPYSKYGNKTIGKPVILLSGMFATSIVYVSHNKSLGEYSIF